MQKMKVSLLGKSAPSGQRARAEAHTQIPTGTGQEATCASGVVRTASNVSNNCLLLKCDEIEVQG